MSDVMLFVFAIVALVAGGWVWRRWRSEGQNSDAG
jgi:hypothetical protein